MIRFNGTIISTDEGLPDPTWPTDVELRYLWLYGDVEERRKINAADEAKWRNLGRPK
jgi:hypothetical protein